MRLYSLFIDFADIIIFYRALFQLLNGLSFVQKSIQRSLILSILASIMSTI